MLSVSGFYSWLYRQGCPDPDAVDLHSICAGSRSTGAGARGRGRCAPALVPWLHTGANEVLVFDLHRTRGAAIRSAVTLHG